MIRIIDWIVRLPPPLSIPIIFFLVGILSGLMIIFKCNLPVPEEEIYGS